MAAVFTKELFVVNTTQNSFHDHIHQVLAGHFKKFLFNSLKNLYGFAPLIVKII